MKSIQLFLFACGFALTANAQKANAFLIYSVKGSVTITENNKPGKAQIGKLLTDQSKLTIGANSLVSIICNESSLFSVTKPGTYTMDQFKDSCLTNKSSITSNYLKFIWNQLTTPKGSPEKNRKSYMNNVGAVSRTNISIWIDSRLDTINYYSGSFPVSWKSYSDAEEFLFEVYEQAEAGKPVYQKTVKKTAVAIADFASKLKPNTPYFWQITVKNEDPEKRKVIYVWEKTAFENFATQLKGLQKGPETEAEQFFRVGFLLESARFYSDAYRYYQRAAQLNPELELYQKTLEAFKKDFLSQ
ncbi:MAG: hypothetical protein ACOVP7_09220 [Lacibacter sp.]